MKYISKRYLEEKWERLKWDMEFLLSSTDDDSISLEDVRRVAPNIWDCINAILRELDI